MFVVGMDADVFAGSVQRCQEAEHQVVNLL